MPALVSSPISRGSTVSTQKPATYASPTLLPSFPLMCATHAIPRTFTLPYSASSTPIQGTVLAAQRRTLSTRHAPGNARGSISWNVWATARARSTPKRFHALSDGRTWTSNYRPSRASFIRCSRSTKPPCGVPICVTESKTKAGTPLPSDRALINARAPPPRPRGGHSSASI